MSDDIVARLRVLNHHAKKLAENESLNDLHRDAFTRCETLTWEAADEIERLREALRIEQEELAACCIDRKETQRERDEARRLYINEMCLRDYGDTSARIREAKARGWNCFDGDGWSDPGDECQREAL